MNVNKALMAFAALLIALFVIMIVTAVVYIGADHLKETACEYDTDLGYHWNGASCQVSTTNTSAVTITAITQINAVVAKVGTALTLLGLIIVIALFAMVVHYGKSMFGGMTGGKGF